MIVIISSLAPLCAVFIILTLWCFVVTPYDIIGQQTRLVLVLVGIIFANIAVSSRTALNQTRW